MSEFVLLKKLTMDKKEQPIGATVSIPDSLVNWLHDNGTINKTGVMPKTMLTPGAFVAPVTRPPPKRCCGW